ncbi:unnamed protein product [Acanthocheilonema viteae]|uniref:Uncharacterized protein n=1 Tax=Acanthocheilonema viteae TaxID=6277 RepID=A0A498SRW8_ACAVI|nr:unnamed protein product [Acanthocheilonema viteae]
MVCIGIASHRNRANRILEINQKPLLGFIDVIIMCFTSAFAGVCLEKVLKRSSGKYLDGRRSSRHARYTN